MPLYEYKCESCGTVFEVIQKFSDPPLSVHADCGGELERLVSPSALHFKGSGWYITDYARGTAKAGSNGGSKPKGESEGQSSEKKEPAPASAPAAEKRL